MESDIEKRTLRRISWRIVPFIMLLYFIAYIDREQGSGLHGFDPWIWCGYFLLGLFSVRSTVQPDSPQGRGAHVDCAGHGHLGPHFRVHGICGQPDQLLRRALPARGF